MIHLIKGLADVHNNDVQCTFPSRSDVLKLSEGIGAISLWSSFGIREVKLSGPAAFPGFTLDSCLDTPLIDTHFS